MSEATRTGDFEWRCFGCGATAPLTDTLETGSTLHLCPGCTEPRALMAIGAADEEVFMWPAKGLWDFHELLPVRREDAVSLGEGGTPLVDAPRLAEAHGFAELRLKNEASNPTASFKDRQVSVAVSRARASGADTVAVVSSGNVAAATAAYCARAGLRAVLFMHGHAGAGKIAQAAAHGATVLRIDSPSPRAVFDLCIASCEHFGWYHGSTAGIYNPFNVEGSKTIAYELWQQYEGQLPDWIVCAVGGGGLLGGLWRGLLDLQRLGLLERLPRLAGVQAAGCAPLKEAIEKGWSLRESLAHPWAAPDTIAGGIADDILFDGHTVLPAIRETQGAAITVTDDEIRDAMRASASTGLLACACSGAALAGLAHLPKEGEGTRACCIISGSGLKDLGMYQEFTPVPSAIPCTLDAVKHAVTTAEATAHG